MPIYTRLILVQTSQKYQSFGYHINVNLRYFFKKLQNISRYTILILVQISRKYLIFGHHYGVNGRIFSENYKYMKMHGTVRTVPSAFFQKSQLIN